MILVSGGAGYIGSHLVHLMSDHNLDVLVVDDLSTGSLSNLPKKIKFININIIDEEKLFKSLENYKIDAVFHFAGSISVEESVQNPLKYFQNNIVTTISLLKLCIKKNIKNFIFSSTAAVYGEKKLQKLVKENHSLNPINPYGKSKLIAESIIIDTCKKHGIKNAILRYFNVAGADPKGRTGQIKKPSTHLISVACETAIGLREKIEIFGSDYNTKDGTCIRDFIHVSDLVDIHLVAYKYLKVSNKSLILNCGYSKGYSVLEVVEATKRISKSNYKVNFVNRRKGDPSFLVADNSKLKSVLKWKPKYNKLDKIVLDTINWERKLQEK